MVKITALLCLLPEQSQAGAAMAVSCRALAAVPGELTGA